MVLDRLDQLVRELARELGVDPEQAPANDPVEEGVYRRFSCVLSLLVLRRMRDVEAALMELQAVVADLETVDLANGPREVKPR